MLSANSQRVRCCVCQQWVEPYAGHWVGHGLVRHNTECKPPAYKRTGKTKKLLKAAFDFLAPAVLATVTAIGCSIAIAGDPSVPDDALTPGVVATTDKAEICGVVGGLTYTKRHRVWTRQRETMAKYGVPWTDHRKYEDDDRLPVAGGGDNADPRNHWPQPRDEDAADGLGYEAKDWLDAYAKRAICTEGTPVAEVQGWFLAPADWRVQYCLLRPDDRRCVR